MAELVSIGTLLAFGTVSFGILTLRRTSPEIPRAFRVPWVPFVPVAAVAGCIILAANLTLLTWIRLAVWFTSGLLVYFSYGRRHSRVQISLRARTADRPTLFRGEDDASLTPEAELVYQLVKGVLVVLVVTVGFAAVLGGLSVYYDSLNRDFLRLAPIVAVIAIIAGLSSAVWPRVRAFWLLRTGPVSFDEESDAPVRDLLKKLGRGTDGRV